MAGQPVLGADLNCSESGRPLLAPERGRCLKWVNRVGSNRGRPTLGVRSTSNSDHKLRGLASFAKCQKRP